MARKEAIEWVSGNEAAAIMTANSGHEVKPAYVRLLAHPNHNKIRSRMKNGREREYHKGDVSSYRVDRKSKEQHPEHDGKLLKERT